jgi:hypothetical protein
VTLVRSPQNLFEDFAAFGTGRKVFEAFEGSNNNVCRRCWFDHHGDTTAGATTASLLYKSKFNTYENVLVTASGAVQPFSFRDTSGSLRTDYYRFPHQILGIDRLDEPSTPKHGYSNIYGAIVYTKASDIASSTAFRIARFALFGTSSLTVRDVISVMDPAHPQFNNAIGIKLNRKTQNCVVKGATCEDPVVDNTAANLTSIRGTTPDVIHSDWTVTNHVQGTSLAAVTAAGANPWTGTTGAQVCYRYQDGALTGTPLWPWPMNDRIKAATARAGRYTGPCAECWGRDGKPYTSPTRSAIDVTADIESLLGKIPASCRR